ncbi:hypothetical protein [Ruminococcus albus]|uniref:Uncharacterized protein n=1 Tax=Ruminococcus albus TaxID=1264 RepID=A0A1H7LZU9_RUMAL|nr:hypothetical protein [Ruminococcus albus]SEL04441.1 hypothetical protein SAMN05216469_11067 [Ruminococcus albus]
MRFENVYFITGTAYAGKSTMVKMLAEKHGGIECGENYHDALLPKLDKAEFPCLTYTRDLVEWRDFVVRTPDEYERWVDGVSKECEILELRILEGIADKGRPVFVDTNISLETLGRITDRQHVLIMLAEPCISVSRFFDRPDREKQFLYQLLMAEKDPEKALENFRQCLMRINSPERNERFANSGFTVIRRDESRTPAETLELVERALGLG